MQTVVLAAGEGTRMRPLTATRPKPMLPVAGRPLVAHTLEAAASAGASRFVVVVGYRADAVRKGLDARWGDAPVEFVEQPEQAGTADAVRTARPALEDAPFVVLNGDALYDEDGLRALYEAAARGPAVGSHRVEDPRPYGVLEIEGDRVTGVVEKPDDPPSNEVNTGAYAFPAAALEWLDVDASARDELELTDVLARTCRVATVRPIELDRWLDVGRPWELLEANEWKLGELEPAVRGEVADDATVSGNVVVEAGAVVRQGVTVEGPVWIGDGASIGPNAYVRGATAVGPGATVGHGVEVKNSVLMEAATVPHLSYVGDSLLSRDVNLGAGTIIANLRHDDTPVALTVKGRRVSTGRRKFGAVLGDGAKTGINASLNAGVTLSVDARVGPGEVVTRDR